MLVSHSHTDHVDPHALADLLAASPRTRLASTRDVVDRVRAALGAQEVEVRARLRTVEPTEGNAVVLQEAAPRIEVFALHHGRRRSIRNLGCLVDVDGLRFLHVGDAEVTRADVEPLALHEREIDIALLPSWYVTGERFRPLARTLGARHILLMHLPVRREMDRHFRRFGGRDGIARLLSDFELPVTPLLRRDRTLCPREVLESARSGG